MVIKRLKSIRTIVKIVKVRVLTPKISKKETAITKIFKDSIIFKQNCNEIEQEQHI